VEAHPYGAAELRGPLPEGQGLETWDGRSAAELAKAIAPLGTKAAAPPIGVSGASPSAGTALDDRPHSLPLPRKGGGNARKGRGEAKTGGARRSSKAKTAGLSAE
jgi:hypothetical protein